MASGSNCFGESRTQAPAVIDLGRAVERRAQLSMCGPFLQGQDMWILKN